KTRRLDLLGMFGPKVRVLREVLKDAAVLRGELKAREDDRLPRRRHGYYAGFVEHLGIRGDPAHGAHVTGVARVGGRDGGRAHLGSSRSATAASSGSPPDAAGRAAGVAQHLVALQRDVELSLELGELRDLHADGGARVERNRPGEVPERPVAI